jgi:hypothetical protein
VRGFVFYGCRWTESSINFFGTFDQQNQTIQFVLSFFGLDNFDRLTGSAKELGFSSPLSNSENPTSSWRRVVYRGSVHGAFGRCSYCQCGGSKKQSGG